MNFKFAFHFQCVFLFCRFTTLVKDLSSIGSIFGANIDKSTIQAAMKLLMLILVEIRALIFGSFAIHHIKIGVKQGVLAYILIYKN